MFGITDQNPDVLGSILGSPYLRNLSHWILAILSECRSMSGCFTSRSVQRPQYNRILTMGTPSNVPLNPKPYTSSTPIYIYIYIYIYIPYNPRKKAPLVLGIHPPPTFPSESTCIVLWYDSRSES